MKSGKIISDQISVADAHPFGTRPFERKNYIEKFKNLTDGIISKKESSRFLNSVQNLKKLGSGSLRRLNVEVMRKNIHKISKKNGIFWINYSKNNSTVCHFYNKKPKKK